MFPHTVYDNYADSIRKEYIHIRDEEYSTKRVQVHDHVNTYIFIISCKNNNCYVDVIVFSPAYI